MGACSQKAPNKEFGIPFQAQNFELDGMHQGMKQRSSRNLAVKDHDVLKSQRSHVREFGQAVKTLRLGLRVKGRVRYPAAFQSDDPDLVQQVRSKERSHHSATIMIEWPANGSEARAVHAGSDLPCGSRPQPFPPAMTDRWLRKSSRDR